MSIKIAVRGNTRSYDPFLPDGGVRIEEYCLEGNLSVRPDASNVWIKADRERMLFTNRNKLYDISKRMSGCEINEVIPILNKYGHFTIEDSAFNPLSKATAQQLTMLKSLFMLYQRFELALLEISINVDEQIYDDFIIDYTGKVGPVKDIYFIPKEDNTPTLINTISSLLDRNMLCEFTIIRNGENRSNFFIPLLKPSPDSKYFDFPNGNSAYIFWRKILSRRNIKINNFINQR